MGTSYSQLRTDIPSWLNNDSPELAAERDKFIGLAELRLSRDLKVQAYDTTVSGTFTIGEPLLDLPDDIVKIRYVRWRNGGSGPYTLLELKDLPYLFEYAPDPDDTGDPRYYAWQGITHIYLAPSPAAASSYELGYTRRLPPLSADNETNWTTENAGDALLYACLIEAAAFAIDNAQIQQFASLYKDAVSAINGEGERTLRDDLRLVLERQENV